MVQAFQVSIVNTGADWFDFDQCCWQRAKPKLLEFETRSPVRCIDFLDNQLKQSDIKKFENNSNKLFSNESLKNISEEIIKVVV